MNLTVAEFSYLYPEFASRASTSAQVIDRNSRGRNIRGEDTFPEDLLRTICYVHEMEHRSMGKHGRIFSSPERREIQCGEARASAEEEGVKFTNESSPAYWQRLLEIANRRSTQISDAIARFS